MTYLTNREAALHLCNGGKLEMKSRGSWVLAMGDFTNLYVSLDQQSCYRAAVEMFQITVRGVTFNVPEPVREPLEKGTLYWVPIPSSGDKAFHAWWSDQEHEHLRLADGLVHLTEAAAVTHAKAMCGVAK